MKTMSNLLSVSDVARKLEEQLGCPVRPRDISTLLYDRVIDDSRCPVVGTRRVIPLEMLPDIEAALIARGVISHLRQEAPDDA